MRITIFLKSNREVGGMIRADQNSADPAFNQDYFGVGPAVYLEARPAKLSEILLFVTTWRRIFGRSGRPPPKSPRNVVGGNEDEVVLPFFY